MASIIHIYKVAAYIVSPILAVVFVCLLIKIGKARRSQRPIVKTSALVKEETGGAVRARWEEVTRHVNSTREAEWKFALVEADKLVDDLLKIAGYPGETMSERLENIKGQLTTLDDLWEAHKIRNRLVHDSNYFLRYTEARRAIQLYEKTLTELNAL